MKTKIKYVLFGFVLSLGLGACASGAKLFDFTLFPRRAQEFSPYFKCIDGDIKNVCRNVCDKYKRDKKTCKKRSVLRIDLLNSIDNGYIVISKPYYLQLITPR